MRSPLSPATKRLAKFSDTRPPSIGGSLLWKRCAARSLHQQSRSNGPRREQNCQTTRDRFGNSGKNQWKIKHNIFWWWAREDSNLQPSGYEPLALTIELRARHSFTTGRSRHRQHNIVDTFIKAARCKRGHPRDRRDHAFRRGDLLVFRRAVGLPAKQQLTRRIGEPVPFPWRARSGRPSLLS